MALLHRATIAPTKGELVAAWLPTRPWAPAGSIGAGVSYRLDDPTGEVGLEAFLLTDSEGGTVHVPLSYRGQPLAGADEHLLGTMEHSVLGRRWVYDACFDDVWAAALARTILVGGTQAELLVDVGGGNLDRREPQVTVRGSGRPGTPVPPIGIRQVDEDQATTTIRCGELELVVVRRVGIDLEHPHRLTATWGDGPADVPVAALSFSR